LTIPIAFAADRRLHHDQIAQKLRVTQEEKRVGQEEKRAAMALKKAALQEAAGTTSVAAGNQAVRSRKRKRVPENKNGEDDDVMDIDEGGT